MTQIERNAKYIESNKKVRISLVIDVSAQEIKKFYNFTHAEIYEAGLKYLIELKDKSQQS